MFKDIQTTEDYWDCECVGMPYEYIHPKSQIMCTECGQHQDDMPDSRVDEVYKMNNATKICKDCLRMAMMCGLDTILLNKTFTIVDVSQCCRTHTLPEHIDSDGFPICLNDCSNWPQTTNSRTFGCACECHE